MPITITLPKPDAVIAPWSFISLASTFIGPLPVGSGYNVYFYTGTEPQPGQNVGLTTRINTQTTGVGFQVGLPSTGVTVNNDTSIAWRPSTPIKVTAILQDNVGSTLDSGTVPGEWQPTSQILAEPKSTTGGGLTQDQALELSETHAATFPEISLDALLLTQLTSGPTGQPVNANLPAWIWGVIVRIANVPADLVVNTPDGDYWTATLCVVRIFRGQDLWLRVPVHTSSKMIALTGEGIASFVTTVLTGQWILDMTLQVTWRPGVTGQVFLMRTP